MEGAYECTGKDIKFFYKVPNATVFEKLKKIAYYIHQCELRLLVAVNGDTSGVNLYRELVMFREAWRAAIQGVTKSRTRLSD